MGISGLLQAMAPAGRPAHVREYEGKTLVIDGATLLYKAAYVSAWEIALGLPPHEWIEPSWQYVNRRLEMFRHHQITPIFVLDGRRSPLKRETDQKRSAIRQGYLRDGHAARDQALRLPEGNPQREALMTRARECFQKAVKAPQELVLAVLARLKHDGVELLVAPFEADAQVAWLCRKGYGDAVVTEDSDLIAYAALAPRPFPVLFKLDASGACVEITYEPAELAARGGNMGPLIRSLRFFTGPAGGRLFLQASIFAGCDYIGSINGIGPITAFEMAVKCRTVPAHNRLTRMVRNLPLKKRRDAPGDWIERAKQAELLFAFHLVFDPSSGRCVTYLPLPGQGGEGQGQGKEGEGEGEGEGEEEVVVMEGDDEPGPVEKEEEAAAAVRAEAEAAIIVIDEDEDDKGQQEQGQEEEQQQRGRRRCLPVLSRPPREEAGLEALDLPAVEPGTDLDAILGERIDEQLVRGVAEARLHPETLEPLSLPRIPKHRPRGGGGGGGGGDGPQCKQEPARPSSSSSWVGLPAFLQQQHASRPTASTFLSPHHGDDNGTGHRPRRPSSSSSSSGSGPAGFRAPARLLSEPPPASRKGIASWAEDEEVQSLRAVLLQQQEREREQQQQQQQQEEEEEQRRRQRGVKRGFDGGGGAEQEGQEGEEEEWDGDALLAAMSPARQQRVAAEAAEAEAAAVDAAASAFPPSSPDDVFCYTLSASNSPNNVGGSGGPGGRPGGFKENVAPSSLLPTLPEEGEEQQQEQRSQQQGSAAKRPFRNPFAVVAAAFSSASKQPPPSTQATTTSAASSSSSSSAGGGSSASDAIAGEGARPASAPAAMEQHQQHQQQQPAKKKRGGIVPFLGPKAPAPLPAPAPVPASSGGGKGGKNGKGKKEAGLMKNWLLKKKKNG